MFYGHFVLKETQMDHEGLQLIISLSKYVDKAVDYEQLFSINLDQEDLFKTLGFCLKNFNENVRKKFDILNKMSVNRNLTDLNWYCREVNVIKILQKLLQLCIDLKSNNFDDIFIEIYSNLSLFGPFLGDQMSKYTNESKKINSHSNSLVFELLTYYFNSDNAAKIDDKIIQNLLKQVENSLDQTSGLQGFLDFYDSKDRLLTLLKTSSSPKSTKTYFIQLISLLNKLFRLSVTSTYWMMKTMAHKQTIVICI